MRSLTPLNIKDNIKLALSNMYSSLDERRDYLPFFTFRLFDNPISLDHGEFDSPHVVGRYLDAFSEINRIFNLSIDTEIIEKLKIHLFNSLRIGREKGTGLAWNENTGTQVNGAWGHNQREALMGLIALSNLLGSEEAINYADNLINDIIKHTKNKGYFPGDYLNDKGWQIDNKKTYPPNQSSRIIRSLLNYYKKFKNINALRLAYEMSFYVANTCFDSDGTWKEIAGTHIHSITGTITSIIDIGIFLSDDFLLKTGKRAFDNGLQPYRSTFGWVQEFRGTQFDRGEANNSGDILQSALLLGRTVDNTYFEDAEKILRNHLIASQLTKNDIFKDTLGISNTDNQIFDDVSKRAVGGFCFSSPNDFKSHLQDRAPINTDLVGGATQSLCEAYDNVVLENDSEIRINLLISAIGESFLINSYIPQDGLIEIIVKKPMCVFLRIPSWVNRKSINLIIDNKVEKPHYLNSYLCLSDRPRRLNSKISFDLPNQTTEEIINGKSYIVEWIGNFVLSVKGPEIFYKELY